MRMRYMFTETGELCISQERNNVTHLSGRKLTVIPQKFARRVFGPGYTKFIRLAAMYHGYFVGTRSKRNVRERFEEWKKGDRK